ncbi:hypothetical protein KPL71_025670 [Citrus sinensis]|uniref:Uncharacterized protein n=1 Tax=Citrus sinensis TaxID=2711 RepID=A0ACB8HUD4_CITSI|nr:hypothetical protein KPL71_025670 [Citrus sinensis]
MHDKASPSISQGPCEPMLMLMVPHRINQILWSLPPVALTIGAGCVAECDATSNEPSSGRNDHVLLLIHRPCINHIILPNNSGISKNELNCDIDVEKLEPDRRATAWWLFGSVMLRNVVPRAMDTAKIKHHYLEKIKFVKWINYALAYIPTVAELKVVKPPPTLLLPVIIVRSVDGGFTIFNSSTVALTRERFIAYGITFRNTATKPLSSRPLIRLRFLDILRCGFEGYQDTLNIHSQRQFCKECYIYGTVEFIFRNAAFVLQNFMIYARRPMDQQTNVVTAQGRTANQNTRILIHNSRVMKAPNLVPMLSKSKIFLGRP